MAPMQITAAALIAAGLAVGFGALVALHIAPTGLSALRNAVSQYGITSYRGGYRVQTIGYAIAGLGAAIGVFALPGPAAIPAGLCLIFAAARALISWFPMDAPGARRTATGRRHGELAVAAFVGVGLAAWQLARLLRHDSLHPAIAATSTALAVVMALALIAMVLSTRSEHSGYFGLIQRGFYLGMTAWLATVAVLLTLPAAGTPEHRLVVVDQPPGRVCLVKPAGIGGGLSAASLAAVGCRNLNVKVMVAGP
jgi:hypothetical protein